MTRRTLPLFRRLKRNTSGLAAIEFALTLPFLLGAGLMGLEVANRTIVEMRISAIASQMADNAARIGDQSMLAKRKIYEFDINDLLYGAEYQGAERLDLYQHGRVIISSLEVVPGTEDQQYIHWQRCMGAKNHNSSYGAEGDGEINGISGMGPVGSQVIAFEGEAVMFVEISYDYQAIFIPPFGFDDEVQAIASYPVRSDRDLTQIYQRDESDPDPIAACDEYGGSSYAGN